MTDKHSDTPITDIIGDRDWMDRCEELERELADAQDMINTLRGNVVKLEQRRAELEDVLLTVREHIHPDDQEWQLINAALKERGE